MQRLKLIGVGLGLLMCGRGGALAASFDCEQARTADEVAICQDRGLSDLDVRMATLFEVVTSLVAMGQRGAIRDDQRDWLAERGDCGADRSCLRQSYRKRIGVLESVLDEIRSHGPF